ncbi:hypothetical protein PI125_g25963 [Phytophthora idaei]|nr:hypothetical protein PI125_g27220 [Phytophthora idaei]KAG3053731.1 hypothetical protein PI125_g25963 [Phytophthora idaei]
MSDALASPQACAAVPPSDPYARTRVLTGRQLWCVWLLGCRLGWRHRVKKKYKWLRVHDERRMHQLEEQEAADGGAVIYGSRVHGAIGGDTRGSMAQGVPVRARRDGKR